MSDAGLINISSASIPSYVATSYVTNSGTAVPTAQVLQVLGTELYNTSASGNVININPNINAFPITPYVVGPVGFAGYQTIQSALDAANADGGGSVYIQTGAYVENLILYPNVQIVGVTGNSDETGVGTDITIIGTHTPADTGYTTISNVYLESTGDIFFSTDAGTGDIALQNCNIGITGSGYTFNLVNWTGHLIKYDVQDNSMSNGCVNNTAGANCFFQNSNMGAGATNSMITSGSTTMKRVDLSCPWTAASGTLIIADFATFERTVTINGTAGGEFNFCRFSPTITGGGAALVWNSTTLLELEMCIIDSTATYAIDGTGTGNLILGSVGFVEGTAINPAITTVALGGFLPNAFGTAGQVWTSNGQGVVPTFQTSPIGQQVRATVASGSATALTLTTPKNVTSISLTTGIWDVTGIVSFTGTLQTINTASVNTTSATLGTLGDNAVQDSGSATALSAASITVPSYLITVSGTQTVYLVAQSTFTGTANAYGRISAIKVG